MGSRMLKSWLLEPQRERTEAQHRLTSIGTLKSHLWQTLRGQLKGKTAEVDIAMETYNALLIDAVREVADQIATLQSIRAQGVEQQAAQASAQTLYEIASQRFDAGLNNRTSVLGAQSAVLAQQRQAIELRARALDAQALLMRATAGTAAL